LAFTQRSIYDAKINESLVALFAHCTVLAYDPGSPEKRANLTKTAFPVQRQEGNPNCHLSEVFFLNMPDKKTVRKQLEKLKPARFYQSTSLERAFHKETRIRGATLAAPKKMVSQAEIPANDLKFVFLPKGYQCKFISFPQPQISRPSTH